jgi:cytoskeletal protein CcmA (bactofilin family)
VPSIISRGLKITGDLKSGGDVQIDGIIEGNIDCRLLTIGQGGEMHGSITAETVRVSGKVEGQLKAKSVTLHKTAEMIGDITHGNLAIEAGAQIDGRISRMQNAGKGDKIASSDPEISARNSAATVQ